MAAFARLRSLFRRAPARSWSSSCGRRRCVDPNATAQPVGLALHRTVFTLEQEAPGKFVASRRTGVPARSTEKCAGDLVLFCCPLAAELAVNLLATFVGPYGTADHSGRAVVEHDGL